MWIDEVTKKAIIEIHEQALPLEEVWNKARIEKTMDALVEAVLCEYEEGAKKASSDMNMETLPI